MQLVKFLRRFLKLIPRHFTKISVDKIPTVSELFCIIVIIVFKYEYYTFVYHF